MSDLLQGLAARLRQRLPAPGTALLLAVSGGCDSMTLWALLRHLGDWPLCIYHLHHGLRESADADAALVATVAAQAAGECLISERADIQALAQEWTCGLEEAGRRQRYQRLTMVAREHGIRSVLTAHHQADQIETVLANLLRGASSVGMGGMRAQRSLAPGLSLLRPLLDCTREQLTALAETLQVRWREDESNRDLRFQRNWLRHVVLPEWEAQMPGIGAELVAFAQQQQQQAQAVETVVDAYWQGHHGRQQLSLEGIGGLSEAQRFHLWRRLLLWCACPLSRRHIRAMEELSLGSMGRQLHLGHVLFHRGQARLHWQAAQPAVVLPRPLAITIGTTIEAGGWCLSVAEVTTGELAVDDPYTACIDAEAVREPLCWREPQRAERWQPMGAPGRKTVLKYLADRKVPSRQRPHWPVLADADGVIWIPGHNLAERVRVRDGTRRWLRLQQQCLQLPVLASDDETPAAPLPTLSGTDLPEDAPS
ncbi:MAG: tRNA lysidine(34) synthetase TilS [Planctomycetota bacterium]